MEDQMSLLWLIYGVTTIVIIPGLVLLSAAVLATYWGVRALFEKED